jgi:hypothetical protein
VCGAAAAAGPVADRLRNLMLRCAALLLVLALLGLPAGGWVLPPPSPSPPPFDGPLAGLPEPDLQNRRCGQSCGANDTTSAMCQGSTVDGRLAFVRRGAGPVRGRHRVRRVWAVLGQLLPAGDVFHQPRRPQPPGPVEDVEPQRLQAGAGAATPNAAAAASSAATADAAAAAASNAGADTTPARSTKATGLPVDFGLPAPVPVPQAPVQPPGPPAALLRRLHLHMHCLHERFLLQ